MLTNLDIGKSHSEVQVKGNTNLSKGVAQFIGRYGMIMRISYESGSAMSNLETGYFLFRVYRINSGIIKYKDYSLKCKDENDVLLKAVGGTDDDIHCVLGTMYNSIIEKTHRCVYLELNDDTSLYSTQMLFAGYLGAIDNFYRINFYIPENQIQNLVDET